MDTDDLTDLIWFLAKERAEEHAPDTLEDATAKEVSVLPAPLLDADIPF
jgi:hypothetical protein